ncbi:MAG TPA: hypothetical protein VNO35_13260 [Steroidobacteraceae bacterium]|nr:hypothetical protein [Steroidobacteraceae bacterium]
MLSTRCLKLAGLNLVLGMSLGIFMGITHNFSLAPVHAHTNLLGWATLALAAVVFRLWPQTAVTRLAHAFFWTYNLSLPVAMVSLGLRLTGYDFVGLVPVVISALLGVWLGAVLFVANLFWSIPAREEPSARGNTYSGWADLSPGAGRNREVSA